MSQTGYTPIQLYRTSTASAVPTAGNLAAGELAINLTDEKLYFKNASGTVTLLASSASASNVGTVTSVAISTGTTGLTVSGSPITSSGTITIGGTLAVANGGTGTSTAFTTGSVVFAGASGVYTQDNANLFWDDTNNLLGIGTSSPGAKLNVVDNSANDALRITQTGTGNALVVEDSANPDSNPFVISRDGRSIQGHTATIDFTGASYLSEVLGYGTAYPLAAGYTGASATGPRIGLIKNRSADWSTNTIVQSGDTLGDIAFTGADGSDYVIGARIIGVVDGTPGVGDMPGRLVFQTTADGASTATERMRIDSSGNVGINAVPQAWGANYKGIEGYGNASFFVSGNSVNGVTHVGNSFHNGTNWVYTTTGAAARYQLGISTAPHIWGYAASGTAGGTVTWSEAMRIDSSGNIGIGMTNPTYKLDVVGGVRNSGYLINANGSTIYSLFANDSGNSYINAVGTGNVGIGTASPSTKLDVAATGGMLRVGGASGNNIIQAYSSTLGLGLWAGGSPRIYSTGAIVFSINGTIGTSAPTGYTDAMLLSTAGYLEATYSDKVVALGNTGTATTINLAQGNVFTATLTGNCTFTLSGANANSSRGSSFTLILTNDATAGRTVAWAGGSFRFPGGAASLSRTTTANAVDIWVFFTPDNGTTWYGNISMKNMIA